MAAFTHNINDLAVLEAIVNEPGSGEFEFSDIPVGYDGETLILHLADQDVALDAIELDSFLRNGAHLYLHSELGDEDIL